MAGKSIFYIKQIRYESGNFVMYYPEKISRINAEKLEDYNNICYRLFETLEKAKEYTRQKRADLAKQKTVEASYIWNFFYTNTLSPRVLRRKKERGGYFGNKKNWKLHNLWNFKIITETIDKL